MGTKLVDTGPHPGDYVVTSGLVDPRRYPVDPSLVNLGHSESRSINYLTVYISQIVS